MVEQVGRGRTTRTGRPVLPHSVGMEGSLSGESEEKKRRGGGVKEERRKEDTEGFLKKGRGHRLHEPKGGATMKKKEKGRRKQNYSQKKGRSDVVSSTSRPFGETT